MSGEAVEEYLTNVLAFKFNCHLNAFIPITEISGFVIGHFRGFF